MGDCGGGSRRSRWTWVGAVGAGRGGVGAGWRVRGTAAPATAGRGAGAPERAARVGRMKANGGRRFAKGLREWVFRLGPMRAAASDTCVAPAHVNGAG